MSYNLCMSFHFVCYIVDPYLVDRNSLELSKKYKRSFPKNYRMVMKM